MDKNNIKRFAVWARRELISRVSQRAMIFDVREDGWTDENADIVNGHVLSSKEKKQRQSLIKRIQSFDNDGYRQTMEEAAYTWFNRFIAIRFMEVNGYLPTYIRVFTDEEGSFKPQIISEAMSMDLDGLNKDYVFSLKEANKEEELYKYLVITQCNALGKNLPMMFSKIEDYTELLFPDNILREGSVISEMVTLIPEEDWKDAVQIIGWLYQYYNAEPKDEVFANLKKNIKVTKATIPAATQIFTPDWIVRYMVENSLGRIWVEGHPKSNLQASWKYWLDEPEQEESVKAELKEIRKEYSKLTPTDLKVIDPCAGSGHILVYMFDVLEQIYQSYGYSSKDAVRLILENNLFGLDIDDRASQLAYFAVMMKARQYDRSILTSAPIQPHVLSIQESKDLPEGFSFDIFHDCSKTARYIYESFIDAKEYGSAININISVEDILKLKSLIEGMEDSYATSELFESEQKRHSVELLKPLIDQAIILAQKYHAVVTNPPYMGSSNMDEKLSKFVKDNYPDTKSDLSTVFMEKTLSLCEQYGMMAMINIPVWMFIQSYSNLRTSIINKDTIVNMVHPGRGIFGSDFGSVSFVLLNGIVKNYFGHYARLFDEQVEVKSIEIREQQFLDKKGRYYSCQENYKKIPGSPIAYWASDKIFEIFEDTDSIITGLKPYQGLATGDNGRFLRLWFEPSIINNYFDATCSEDCILSEKKWYPYNKGGDYRKWYGNVQYLVNWKNDGFEIKHFVDSKGKLRSRPQNTSSFFLPCGTWSKVTSSSFSMRYIPQGYIYDVAGCSLFADDKDLSYVIAFCNSVCNDKFLSIISPTLNYEVGHIASLPIRKDERHFEKVTTISNENIGISKSDWDSFETSWDFTTNPLVSWSKQLWDSTSIGATMSHYYETKPEVSCSMELCYLLYKGEVNERFDNLKNNEEELNRIFIDIYGLQDELTPEEDDSMVSVHRIFDSSDEIPDAMKGGNYALTKKDVVKNFISYAVGCMFGRYSLNKEGLAYAGGEWNDNYYSSFIPDKDNIIPICDDDYFEDDIVGRFINFVRVVFGEEDLEANLKFIADALEGKGSAREIIRSYFLNDFYLDHCSMYSVTGSGKRPIYWLLSSGKKNGFKALMYMHRYQSDTVARVRTDYVHPQQARLWSSIEDLEGKVLSATGSEATKLKKRLKTIKEQSEELKIYEEKVHHIADQMIDIDLDNGVKHNYELFKDILAPIK